MELEIVNPQLKYSCVTLTDPPPTGYIQIAAAVEPPLGRTPFPRSSERKTALLSQLKSLARELERLDTVAKATVYRGILSPPTAGYARKHATRIARYDVVVLVETTSVDALGDVQRAEPYRQLVDALTGAARDVYVMTARCAKRIGDVDKTRQGLFLFNYFVAEDPEVALALWDRLAAWYVVETDLDNSTLLVPLGDTGADYVFVNHARWDDSLPRFAAKQFTKKSFRTYVLANLRANKTGAMPNLYRLV